MIIFLAFLLSACSFAYQFLFVRILSYSVQNEILVQSLSLGVFLLFAGIGMHLAPKFIKDSKRFLFRLEIALSIFGASLVLIVQCLDIFTFLAHDWFAFLSTDGKICIFLWIPAFLGFLTGMELPALFDLQKKQNFMILLAFNYFGGIVGAVFFSLVLFPMAELGWIGVFLGFLNLLAAILIRFPKDYIERIAFVFASSCFFLFLKFAPTLHEIHGKTFVMQFRWQRPADISIWVQAMRGLKPLERIKTPFQLIDLVPDGFLLSNPLGRDFHLFMNGQLQFSRDSVLGYHESLVFGSLNLSGSVPKRALVLGGGDGLVVTQLLKAGVREIDLVEIDAKVVQLAKEHPTFRELNQDSLLDPKVKIHYEDAFTFLVNHREQWDAIFLDFPFPTNYELLKLYSVEFYERVKLNLSAQGFFAFDAPVWVQKSSLVPEMRPYPQEILLKTLQEAGFEMAQIFGPKEPFFFVSKSGQPREFVYDRLPSYLSGKTRYNLLLLTDLSHSLDSVEANRLLKPERIRW